MKIRKTSAAAAAADTAPAAADPDLKSVIRDHSLFFDRLVDLIPARFYLPAPDDDRTPFEFLTKPEKAVARAATRRNLKSAHRTPFEFLTKPEKAVARAATRRNLKSARRARLDPATPSATLHLLHNTIHHTSDDEEDDAPSENPLPVAPSDRSVTYEELRQRLHRRIEQLRSARHTDPDNDDDNPRPRKNRINKKDAKKNKKLPQEKRKRVDAEKPEENNKKAKPDPTPAPEPADFTFGQVKIGDEDSKGKKKKLSKAQALERAKRLEESKKDPEKGEKVAEKHSWKTAVSRAAGVKVHDDPKLLKESIKKERRRQQKHAEQWKERVESRDKVRSEKQKKRTDNIKDRIHQKKQRRIEKREKKLMRPGFEGRKEGFINK